MGRFVRVTALCWAVEVVVAKVVTVKEGVCSTDSPAPSYGWVSTNGSTVPWTFPPTSVSVPPVSLPEPYPSTSVPQIVTGTVAPIPAPSSSVVLPPVYPETPVVPPVYSETPVIPPASSSAVVAPTYTVTPIPTSAPVPTSDTPTPTDQFTYITPDSSVGAIVAPTASSSATCAQTAPQGSTIQCPSGDGLTFCQEGENYGLRCGIHYDLITMNEPYFTYDPAACLASCMTTPGCQAIEWSEVTSDCTLCSGILGVTAEVSPYVSFLYNRASIQDSFLPTSVCPFGGCTEQQT